MPDRRNVLRSFHEKYDRSRVEAGIEQNRKGRFLLQFRDAAGKPVAGVRAEIRQKNHAFKYGANLFMLGEFEEDRKNQEYQERFKCAFNLATLPFYWDALEPEQGKPRYTKDSPKIYRRPSPDMCLEFCEANHIEPKAHCLNYASFSPKWAVAGITQEKVLLLKRFRELSERYADRIRDWEVTNETFWDFNRSDLTNFYRQPDFVEWSFTQADRLFPANRLIINEAHCFIWDNLHFYGNRSPYFMQIERALSRGARIDSIGMQFHMFYPAAEETEKTAQFYDPERIFAVLDTYSALGKNLQITEFTIPAYSYTDADEAIQAEIMEYLYSIWFSHPAMEAIIYWNLIDGYAAFAPQGDMTAGENYFHGGLLRHDFTPKPAYHVVQELFQKKWRTNVVLQSGESAELAFCGFYGDYEINLTVGEASFRKELSFDRQSLSQRCVILEM